MAQANLLTFPKGYTECGSHEDGGAWRAVVDRLLYPGAAVKECQARVIEALLSGDPPRALALFPTGMGKSFVFQSVAITLGAAWRAARASGHALATRPGVTVVVSPLIALMVDQVADMSRRGVAAARLDSNQDHAESDAVVQAVREGSVDLLYVAPERMQNEGFVSMLLQDLQVLALVVDEAHSVDEHGHNFRPDYLKLSQFADTLQRGAASRGVPFRLVCLTATATPAAALRIAAAFGIPEDHVERAPFYRPNLELAIVHRPPETLTTGGATVSWRLQALEEILQRMGREDGASVPPETPRILPPHIPWSAYRGRVLVYVTLPDVAMGVAAHLNGGAAGKRWHVRYYHGQMVSEERQAVQEWFASHAPPEGELTVLVATGAFGMGVNVADVGAVIHYTMPKNIPEHAQAIGRGGRDGRRTLCLALVDYAADRPTLVHFAHGDNPPPGAPHIVVAGVFGAPPASAGDPDTVLLSTYDLAFSSNAREIVVKTMLTYLALDGWVESGTAQYDCYTFRLVSTEDPNDCQGILRRAARFGRTQFTLDDFADACGRLDLTHPREGGVPWSRADLVAVLHRCPGCVDVKRSKLRIPFRVLRRPSDDAALRTLGDMLAARMTAHCQADVARVDAWMDFATAAACPSAALCAYFGTPLPPLPNAPLGRCGSCLWCWSGGASSFVHDRSDALEHAAPDRGVVAGWVQQLHAAGATRSLVPGPSRDACIADVFTRYLTGINTPWSTRARFKTKCALFGVATNYDFEMLRSCISECLNSLM